MKPVFIAGPCVIETNVIITKNGEAKAVLMDIETYQDTEDAFAIMNIIKIAEKDIENVNVKKADDVFKDLRKRITENGYENKGI